MNLKNTSNKHQPRPNQRFMISIIIPCFFFLSANNPLGDSQASRLGICAQEQISCMTKITYQTADSGYLLIELTDGGINNPAKVFALLNTNDYKLSSRPFELQGRTDKVDSNERFIYRHILVQPISHSESGRKKWTGSLCNFRNSEYFYSVSHVYEINPNSVQAYSNRFTLVLADSVNKDNVRTFLSKNDLSIKSEEAFIRGTFTVTTKSECDYTCIVTTQNQLIESNFFSTVEIEKEHWSRKFGN